MVIKQAGSRLQGTIEVARYMESMRELKRRLDRTAMREALRWLATAKDEADRQRVRELYKTELSWINRGVDKPSE